MADSPSQLLDSVIDFSSITPRRPNSEEEEENEWKEEEQKKKKKRRLTGEQVHSLEKSFEVDSKLEPDRKIKLALELNLKPRQVAIWFQNKRARSKTKQLHSDYAALKSHCDHLANHNNHLQNQVSFLKDKLSNMEGKSVGTAEETISDVLDSGSTSADFQMAANAFAFGLPTLDFDPSFDPSYCSWLY